MAHTPGPWLADKPLKTMQGMGVYCDDATGSIVAQVGGFLSVHRSDQEDEANAHLISAAPELLEALKDMNWAMVHVPSCQKGVVDRCRCEKCSLQRSREAIKKAEGR